MVLPRALDLKGWKQNSLVVVDTVAKTFRYTYEYYFLKHISHFVKPGSKRLQTSGNFNNLLAFVNPDKSVVVIAQNETETDKKINVKAGDRFFSLLLKANTINTFLLSKVE